MTRRIAIVGVGLGGVLVGRALSKQGVEVTYFGRRADAQWHPAALVHPFPGRSLKLTLEIRESMEVVNQWMKDELPGRRVWVDRALALESRERRTYESSHKEYPDWLEHHFDGERLRYPGWVVDMSLIPSPKVLSELADWVEVGANPSVGFEGSQRVFDAVVICPGRELKDWWVVPIVEQGGEAVLNSQHVQPEDLVSCDATHKLPWRSGMALSKSFLAPGQVRSDLEVLEDFEARSGLMLKGSEVWRGVRCISGDRQPICGHIQPNIFLLGALGARGLLLGPLLAERLATLILLGQDSIPKMFSSDRLLGVPGPQLRGSES